MTKAANHKVRAASKRLAIFQRDGFACCYCGVGIESKQTMLTIDHIIPIIYGGTHDSSNLVTCCKYCNNWKGEKFWKSFVIEITETIRKGVNPDYLIGYIETQRHISISYPDGVKKITNKRFDLNKGKSYDRRAKNGRQQNAKY